MLKKTITYTDYNGTERTEDFYFNLTKAECIELQLEDQSLTDKLKTMIQTNDASKVIDFFKAILIKAYGVRSEDGRRFIKNDEVRNDFMQTEAYSDLFMECAMDPAKAADFINGILPADLLKEINNNPEVQKEMAKLTAIE